MNHISIESRENITDLLNNNSIGCELGVFEGEFSNTLIQSNKFKKLYLVDYFSGPAWNFGKYYSDTSVLFDEVKNRFENDNRVSVIKQSSIDFLKSTDIIFNFIYIDTVHSYEHLNQELSLAHKIIKPGGYICGHDYCTMFQGVIDSVQDFIQEYKYDVYVTPDPPYNSFIIKVAGV